MVIRAIETTATLSDDGHMVVDAEDLAPGEYRVIILIEREPVPGERSPLDLPIHDVGPWPDNLSLRRADIYDDGV